MENKVANGYLDKMHAREFALNFHIISLSNTAKSK